MAIITNMKRKLCLVLVGFLIFGLFGVVGAASEMLISDFGVEYESRILDEFSKLKINETDNETFVEVIIYLNDFFEAENLISDFSEDELIGEIDRQLPNRSSNKVLAKISEEAFFKLIQNDVVEKINYNAPMYLSLSEKNSFNGTCIFVFLFILSILFGAGLFLIIKRVTRKNVNISFLYLILTEILLGIVFYFIPFSWHNSCTPSFFNPFGMKMGSEMICLPAFTKTVFPIFYFLTYLLIITLIVYLVYVLSQKIK